MISTQIPDCKVQQLSSPGSLLSHSLKCFAVGVIGTRQSFVLVYRWWLVLKDSFLVYLKRKSRSNKQTSDREHSNSSHHQHLWKLCNVLLIDRNFAFKLTQDGCTKRNRMKIYNSHGLIDGEAYMKAVAKAIDGARYELFITDWLMNPEIYLRRPIHNNDWRLDKLLTRKAEQGVRICILLYAEFEPTSRTRNRLTARYLQGLNPNIHVFFSPMTLKLWSHHEKLVIVDQSVAFVGGIDLCYGRWDTQEHLLQDLHRAPQAKGRGSQQVLKTQRNMSSAEPLPEALQRKLLLAIDNSVWQASADQDKAIDCLDPDMPVGRRHVAIASRPVSDSREQEREEWIRANYGQRRKSSNWLQRLDSLRRRHKSQGELSPATNETRRDSIEMTESYRTEQRRRRPSLFGHSNTAYEDDDDTGPPDLSMYTDLEKLYEIGERCTWIGQDYVNWNVEEPYYKLGPAQDLYDRHEVARMPWHDVSCVISGKAANDVARHFIQRWNAIRIARIRNSTKGTSDRAMRRRKPLLLPSTLLPPWIQSHLTGIVDDASTAVRSVQVVRSVSNWSLGIPSRTTAKGFRTTFHHWITGPSNEVPDIIRDNETLGCEASIRSAYIDLILNAEHFVYIENQYFVSYLTPNCHESQHDVGSDEWLAELKKNLHLAVSESTDPGGSVKNLLVDALFYRILHAHKEKSPFRVYLILPLFSGFAGEVGGPTGTAIHILWHYIRQSLYDGINALFPRLREFAIDPDDYVSVCGLRTYDEWPNARLKTEIIYVHSKMMVVDDRRAIIGSANINDRSMLGFRDSEMAVVIEASESDQLEESSFCGRPVRIDPFVRQCRESLMAEHLGLLSDRAYPPGLSADSGDGDSASLHDPVDDRFFHLIWRRYAQLNADLFDETFDVIPSNRLPTFKSCAELRNKIKPSAVDPMGVAERLKSLQGSLVTFPEKFLCDEYLLTHVGQKEHLVPEQTWT